MNVEATCINSKGKKLYITVNNVSNETELLKAVAPNKLIYYRLLYPKITGWRR